MASNSAVVMPLRICCLEKIQRRTEDDRHGQILLCRACGNYIVYWDFAWKSFDDINYDEWEQYWETLDD